MTEALYHDPAFARYYDAVNPWSPDRSAVVRLAESIETVMDLGCGTGSLAVELARRGKRVTGVDPAPGMLGVARTREGGVAVDWVEAGVEGLDLGRRFELISMTGHAFQCLLTEAARAGFYRCLARHLAPGGRFVFDSRNPTVSGWKDWTNEDVEAHDHPVLGRFRYWSEAWEEAGLITYRTVYETAGGRIETDSRLAFPAREEIDAGLVAAGLAVDEWWGDWDGTPSRPDGPELIPLGRLAG